MRQAVYSGQEVSGVYSIVVALVKIDLFSSLEISSTAITFKCGCVIFSCGQESL